MGHRTVVTPKRSAARPEPRPRHHRHLPAAVLIAALEVVAAVTFGVACGRGGGGALASAENAMAKLDAGRLDLTLTATAGDTNPAGPVGFRIEGPFAIDDDRDLPTFDLRYTTLLGDSRRILQVVSDGQSMHVVENGVRTPVPAKAAEALRLGSGDGGFGDLGIAGWAEETTTTERDDGTRVVTGRVDVADLLSDLVRISGQTGGSADLGSLDGDAARRLDQLVRHSEFTAEIDRSNLPRNLQAVIDFGQQSDQLRDVLGPYATPRLEITLKVEPAPH